MGEREWARRNDGLGVGHGRLSWKLRWNKVSSAERHQPGNIPASTESSSAAATQWKRCLRGCIKIESTDHPWAVGQPNYTQHRVSSLYYPKHQKYFLFLNKNRGEWREYDFFYLYLKNRENE